MQTVTPEHLLGLLPSFGQAIEEMGWEDFIDDEIEIHFLKGDVDLDTLDLKDVYRLAVDGDVTCAGMLPGCVFCVSGDIHCSRASIGGMGLLTWVGGVLHTRRDIYLFAEDHEQMINPPRLRLDTPILYAWFTYIHELEIPTETVIFLLGDWEYCESLDLPNPVFLWHESVYALDDDFYHPIPISWDDGFCINFNAIDKALAQGKSIWRRGFDLQTLPLCRQAAEALKAGDAKVAYLLYRQATEAAPGYFPAAEGMGEALWHVGAFRQALAAFLHAASLFPFGQPNLPNTALISAGYSALRLADFEEAERICTRLIESAELNDSGDESDFIDGFRIRGEVRLRTGRLDEAQSDLERVLFDSPRHSSANWLMGKLLHTQAQLKKTTLTGKIVPSRGLIEKAREHQAMACRGNVEFGVAFEDAEGTGFLSPPPCEVDWQELDPGGIEVQKDAAYWLRFMTSSELSAITRVPGEMRSAELLAGVLAQSSESRLEGFVEHFPATSFTPEIACELMRRHPANLQWIPLELRNKSIYLIPSTASFYGTLGYLPEDQVDEEVCWHAVRGGESPANLPTRLVDKNLCLEAVKVDSYRLGDVPSEILDEDIFIQALAYGGDYFIDRYIPSRFKTIPFLKRAVALNRNFMECAPARLIDEELLGYAEQLYGEDSDWPDIVARHDQAFCRAHPEKECAEACWLAFWDETFMLEQIAKDEHELSAYEIPVSRYTQAVAKAAFDRSPIHLDSIPPEFVTQEMALEFISRYPEDLYKVPMAQRSIEVCCNAAKKERSQLQCVPADIHAAVMERIIAPSDTNIRAGLYKISMADDDQQLLAYFRLICGLRRAMSPAPDLELTRTDIEAYLAAGGKQVLKEIAHYSLGYCYFRAGQKEQAEKHMAQSGSGISQPYDQLSPTTDILDETIYAAILDKVLAGDWNGLCQKDMLSHIGLDTICAEAVNPAWMYLERAKGLLMLDAPDFSSALDDLAESQRSGQLCSEDLAMCRYLTGYCHYLAACPEEAAGYLDDSGLVDVLGDYPAYRPAYGKPLNDLDRDRFGLLMHEVESMQETQPAEAWTSVSQAEHLLDDAKCEDDVLWAFMLDKKRWLAFELELWEEHEHTCRDTLRRLEEAQLWPYLNESDQIRHVLRAAYYHLGVEVLRDERVDDTRLRAAIVSTAKALSLVCPSEDETVLYPYYEGHVALHLQLAAPTQKELRELNKRLKTMRGKRFQRHVALSMDEVLAALERTSTDLVD